MRRREFIIGGLACGTLAMGLRAAADTLAVSAAQIKQIVEALSFLGAPLPAEDSARVLALCEHPESNAAEIDRILDKYTLIRVQLGKHGVGVSSPGVAGRQLQELGWRAFLVRVENPAQLTGPMLLVSRAAIAEGALQPRIHEGNILGNDVPEILSAVPATHPEDIAGHWLGYRFGADSRMAPGLQGRPLEYQILQLYSQSGEAKTAAIAVCASSAARWRILESKGFTADFNCLPASTVTLQVRDWDGVGAMASLLIRDEAGRLYPAPGHRLEPDLGYQPQIYRADDETVRLPAGRYQILASRGPEYFQSRRELIVPPGGEPATLAIDLRRWIHPARLGWYPGDPHLHAEAQPFGTVSSLGVTPETMLRQVLGEGLSIGSILIWTCGYYYMKQFLTGHVYRPSYRLPFPEAQRDNNVSLVPRRTPRDEESLIRYDVEQAAFPSNLLGHPVLLRLKHHDYPGARSVYHWPSWNLPIMQWARAQGAVAGYAHVGHALDVGATELPNYEIPAFDGIGANECLIDVTHGLVDFLAGAEFHPVQELNLWYHLLNCGFELPMIGETDFSGIGGRVGASRTYVRLDRPPRGDDGYDRWVEGIKAGRLYYGDGRSHIIDFRANARESGEGPLALSRPGRVTLAAKVAAWLDETPVDPDEDQVTGSYGYWHLERARIGASRRVPLEVVVNGQVVERREVLADGELHTLSIAVSLDRSSWVALRILPSVHTAPIFVSLAGQPVRASRRSAQWCLDCVEKIWQQHGHRIRESERAVAVSAWDHAREVYRRIMSESRFD